MKDSHGQEKHLNYNTVSTNVQPILCPYQGMILQYHPESKRAGRVLAPGKDICLGDSLQ